MLRKPRKRLGAGLLALGAAAAALLVLPGRAEPEAVAQPATAPPAPAKAAPGVNVTAVDGSGVFRVDGKRFFPIGLTMPPPLDGVTPLGVPAIDALVAGGVTVFRTGPSGRPWSDELLTEAHAWNEAAAERGVYTWAHLRELARAVPGSEEEATLRHVVETLKDDPGLAFWKGQDEPWPLYDPAILAHAYDLVKAADPNHLVHTIFGPFSKNGSMYHKTPDPPNLRPYNRVTDAHGIDVYPVYHLLVGVRENKLHMVGRWLRALRGATGRDALTMTLQICFKGSKNRDGDDFVLPTKREERYMAYDAIVNGARGLFFFGGELARCHRQLDAAYGWNWTFWEKVLEDLLAEIRKGSPLYPALIRPETTVRLRATGTRTEAISRRSRPGQVWVIAAHSGKRAERVTIRGLPRWARTGRLYPSGARVTAKDRRITLRFPGWGVRVIRLSR